jgi:hypothetical protein
MLIGFLEVMAEMQKLTSLSVFSDADRRASEYSSKEAPARTNT